MCKDLPQQALVPGQACNCTENWSSPVIEDFVWQNIAYRYLSFTPSEALISSIPTYIMTLQVFFNCEESYQLQLRQATDSMLDNATFSLTTSSQEQAPSLYMAVYDPSFGMMDALQRGYSRMVLIGANGDSSINIGLQYRQDMGHTPAYDYSMFPHVTCAYDKLSLIFSIALGVSTVPNMNLVCNTASNDSYPCHITLFLQMPSFDRTIVTENAMISWMVSGPDIPSQYQTL